MKPPDCRYQLLIDSQIGYVTACAGCGQVDLTLQHLTLRFEAEAFRTLAMMLNQAQRRLDDAAATNAAAVPVAITSNLH